MSGSTIIRTILAVASGPVLLLPLLFGAVLHCLQVEAKLDMNEIYVWLVVGLGFGVIVSVLNAYFERLYEPPVDRAGSCKHLLEAAGNGHRSAILRCAIAGELYWLQFVFMFVEPERVWMCLLLSFLVFHMARKYVSPTPEPRFRNMRIDRTGLRIYRNRMLSGYAPSRRRKSLTFAGELDSDADSELRSSKPKLVTSAVGYR